ncbi:Putative regulator of cell autolysis [Luteibacter sp. UNC138MFCol5.1]|uniref:sensor histidine kinase n=1 Tax=Luteibacter sp. UNC138MFCol5.1 TaxID=1502774 RepID=UPI0008D299B4|nr:histidine kinase [Luteibacter sp. UNC138MFCol5.1]SEO77619.1 Putative regulator of cell autolysis [Luteibacter sp. UNC138MFCol5.1]
MASLKFVIRLVVAWLAAWCVLLVALNAIGWGEGPLPLVFTLWFVGLLVALARGATHLYRVRVLAGRIDAETVSNRQRRRVEVPYPADEAFAIVEAVVRELPNVRDVGSTRGGLQVRAEIPPDLPQKQQRGRLSRLYSIVVRSTKVVATVTPGDGSSSVMYVCEPDGGAWIDWFNPDGGASLEYVETLVRATTQRLAERRNRERDDVRQSKMEKELTAAQLGLLQAQVEPHFLYNTLASAQELVRTDPARADRMLGHLIAYLRRSLPRTDGSLSTLGEELERSTAWLEIMQLRMGERLAIHVDVPAHAQNVPMPSMMLQTLVENAIKHGLEPKPGGGGVWIRAGVDGAGLSLTVADDGLGFRSDGAGTGIGLKNLRERLRLMYGSAATFSIGNNFPSGVAATITLPVTGVADHA